MPRVIYFSKGCRVCFTIALAARAQERAVSQSSIRFNKPCTFAQRIVSSWQLLVDIVGFQNSQKLTFVLWAIRGKLGGRSQQTAASICRRSCASQKSQHQYGHIRYVSQPNHLVSRVGNSLNMQPFCRFPTGGIGPSTACHSTSKPTVRAAGLGYGFNRSPRNLQSHEEQIDSLRNPSSPGLQVPAPGRYEQFRISQ